MLQLACLLSKTSHAPCSFWPTFAAQVHLATESDVRSSGKGKGPAAANETVAALPEGKKVGPGVWDPALCIV